MTRSFSLWASDNWGHLAGYEKRLMGVAAPYDVTEGWYMFNAVLAQAHKAGQSVTRAQKTWLVPAVHAGQRRVQAASELPPRLPVLAGSEDQAVRGH